MVSQRQQWFAIYLLTGESPKESLNAPCGTSERRATHVRSVLQLATELLCNSSTTPPASTTLALLEFLSAAADFWPWVVSGLLQNSQLFDAFMALLDDLEPPEHGSGPTLASHTIKTASYVVDLLTMLVYDSRSEAKASLAKRILPHLGYPIHHATAQPAYNSSLHSSCAGISKQVRPDAPLPVSNERLSRRDHWEAISTTTSRRPRDLSAMTQPGWEKQIRDLPASSPERTTTCPLWMLRL